ncbi:MAG: hypothetical protein PHP49_00265 [Bacilli bacterium]|nr:hypothetical protein [Bacilli bacterium]
MTKDKKYDAIMKKLATKRAKVNVPTYDSKVMMAHWSNGYN